MLPGLTFICFYLSFYPILKGAGCMLFCFVLFMESGFGSPGGFRLSLDDYTI